MPHFWRHWNSTLNFRDLFWNERGSVNRLPLGASASATGAPGVIPKAALQTTVEQRMIAAAAEVMVQQVAAKTSATSESNANIKTAAERATQALTAENDNKMARGLRHVITTGNWANEGRLRRRHPQDIGLKDVPMSAGGSGGGLSTADIDTTFSKVGLQHV